MVKKNYYHYVQLVQLKLNKTEMKILKRNDGNKQW